MLPLYPLDTARDWKGSTEWKRKDGHQHAGAKVGHGNSQKQHSPRVNVGNRARTGNSKI